MEQFVKSASELVAFWRRFKKLQPPFVHPDDEPKLGQRGLLELDQHWTFQRFVADCRFYNDNGFHLSLLPIPYVGDISRGDIFVLLLNCQSASNFDPRSASNFDPLERRVLAVALAPSELVGVAETARARVVG
jgi:hypothetical protein